MSNTKPTIKSEVTDWDYKYYVVDTRRKKYIYGFSSRKEAASYAAVCKKSGIMSAVVPKTEIDPHDLGQPYDLNQWSEYFPKQAGITDEE